MPPLHLDEIDRLADGSVDHPRPPRRDQRRVDRDRLARSLPAAFPADPPPAKPHARADGRETFRCGRCRVFVGPTVSGGRHRNHCPLCLTSRHVDHRRPGDRASPCRALMAPVGTFFRPKGEQVLLHCCNGCGRERYNRIAADDNPLAVLRLPPVAPRHGRRQETPEEAIA